MEYAGFALALRRPILKVLLFLDSIPFPKVSLSVSPSASKQYYSKVFLSFYSVPLINFGVFIVCNALFVLANIRLD